MERRTSITFTQTRSINYASQRQRPQFSHFSMMVLFWTALFILTVFSPDKLQAMKVPIPIKADDETNIVERDKIAGCHFDNHFYELEDTWHPDLGPPFGIMYCVRCECLAFPRKGQITGKVRCRNFKLDCPKPDCPEPILLPNQCCKVCPQNSNKARQETEEKNEIQKVSEYVSVIGSLLSRHVARGTFDLDGPSLHYTIHFSSGFQPTTVRFQDEEGNALFTQTVDDGSIRSQKICGVWDRVPRVYRRSLTKESLQVVLTGRQDSRNELKGTIVGKKIIFEETFSALMQSKDTRLQGVGGIASIALTSEGNSYDYSILLQGMPVLRKDVKQVAVISLEKTEDGSVVREITGVISTKTMELSGRFSDFSHQENRLLTRGLLRLSLRLSNGPEFSLIGPISAKMTCNIFQAVIYDVNKPRTRDGPGAGVAIFNLQSDGNFAYRLSLPTFNGRPTHVSLETNPKKGRRRVDDFVNSYSIGWANGTTSKPNPKDIQNLLSDDLVLSISNDNAGSRMQGQIRQLSYQPVYYQTFPSIIRENPSASFLRDMSGSAVAWLHLDEQCVLSYGIMIDGYSDIYLKKLQAVLAYSYNQQGSLVRKLAQLEPFKKNKSIGKLKNLKNDVLMGMLNGTIEVLITTVGESEPRLRGQVTAVDECSAKHRFNGFVMEDPASMSGNTEPTYSCQYRDKIHDDGSSWKSEHKQCSMCSCQRGKITCEDIVCPKLNCRNPYKVEGECCMTCHLPPIVSPTPVKTPTFNNQTAGCYLDKKWHKPGAQWHPYIVPFGFSKCAICTCMPGTFTVNCTRVTCPSLTCSEVESYRENPSDCCKRCPEPASTMKPVGVPNDTLADEGIINLPEDLLKDGGCRFQTEIHRNGVEWNPRVQPFGVMNCVLCRCKDGKASCKRQRCPKLTCPLLRKEADECCPRCTDESDPKARPNRRLTRKQKKQRKRRE